MYARSECCVFANSQILPAYACLLMVLFYSMFVYIQQSTIVCTAVYTQKIWGAQQQRATTTKCLEMILIKLRQSVRVISETELEM